jgi:hypothetical protein
VRVKGREERTAGGGGDAGARHDDDAAGPARLDEVGDSSEAALRQGPRRGVLADVRLLLTHLEPPVSFAFGLLGLGVGLLSLHAEVVEIFEVVKAVKLVALVWARPSSMPAAYFGDAAAVPSMRGTGR